MLVWSGCIVQCFFYYLSFFDRCLEIDSGGTSSRFLHSQTQFYLGCEGRGMQVWNFLILCEHYIQCQSFQ